MNNVEYEEILAPSEETQPTARGKDSIGASHKRQADSSSSNDEPRVNGLSSDGSHMFVFTNEKAGMKSIDKERANRIIYEMSKNSPYFKQAELQDRKLDVKVQRHVVFKIWQFKLFCARRTSHVPVNTWWATAFYILRRMISHWSTRIPATPSCTTVVQIKRARLENASRTTHPETHL